MDHYFLPLMNGGAPLCTIQRLKAKCDDVLSNVAFNLNLRRYITGNVVVQPHIEKYRSIKKTAGGKFANAVYSQPGGRELMAGAYTRPLFSSTCAVSDRKAHSKHPLYPLPPPKHPRNNP